MVKGLRISYILGAPITLLSFENNFLLKQILFTLSILSSFALSGQKYEPTLINHRIAGGIVEVGIPFYAIQEGDRYTPLLMGGVFEIPVYQTRNIFNVSFSFHPLVGIVFLDNDQAYEFGLNVRFNLNLAVTKHDVLKGAIGIGPHFMDHTTRRQAYGWLLADYFLIGYRRYFLSHEKYHFFGIRGGYRHLSNSNIWNPNGGISNFIIEAEVGVSIGPPKRVKER
jgi:hypothetical protein